MKSVYIRITIIIFIVIILLIIGINDIAKDFRNYEVIHVGDGRIKVPKEEYNCGELSQFEGSVLIKTDDYIILGVDLPVKDLDETVLHEIGFSSSTINDISSVDDEYNLKDLLNIEDKDLVDIGHVRKPSFQKYLIRYKDNNKIVTVGVYCKDDRSMLEIISASEYYFTDEEYGEMFSGISY